MALSPDGSRLAYVAQPASGARRIFVRATNDIDARPLAGTAQAIRPRPLLVTPETEVNRAISPDGAWLAYVSNESGEQMVHVRRSPSELGTGFGVTADGAHFAFPKPPAASNRIIVALGLLDELRERMSSQTAK